MTPWDIRTFLRALGAALLGLVVVWLVTAASDEGQLTVSARVGRTLPLAPLCSAVGAALALGSTRVRQEARALEALGRSPAQTSLAAAFGAALPSLLIGLAIALSAHVDVTAFYPRAATGELFVATEGGFVSPSLGVLVDRDGEILPASELPSFRGEEGLPHGARAVAATATVLSGVAFALIAARALLRRSLLDRSRRRRTRAVALLQTVGTAIFTLVAFQTAAVHLVPAALAIVPPLALFGIALAALFPRGGLSVTKAASGYAP